MRLTSLVKTGQYLCSVTYRKNRMREFTDERRQRLLEKTRGCMIGGAAGDALGYPVEFMSYRDIIRRYGEDGITRFELNGNGVAEISDDTQMSLFTAASALMGLTRGFMRGIGGRPASYVRSGHLAWLYTQEHPSREEGKRFDTWLMDVPELYSRRAPGYTCLSALRAMSGDGEPVNDSCGCGGVMRTAPLAAICARYETGFEENDAEAADAEWETHKHQLGYIPAAILNHILYDIFTDRENRSLERIVTDAITHFSRLTHLDGERVRTGDGKGFRDNMERQLALIRVAKSLAHSGMDDVGCIEHLGGGWTGHEALAIAVFCALRYPDDLHRALVAAVNHSGDSDSTGSITGNIVGAYSGIGSIMDMVPQIELLDVIEELSEDMASGCVISEYDPDPETPEKDAWFTKYCQHRRVPGRRQDIARNIPD